MEGRRHSVERVVSDFLSYQLTAYPFSDTRLYAQLRRPLNLDGMRRSPLLAGPFVTLSRAFAQGISVKDAVKEGLLHPHIANLATHPHLYGHQEEAIRAILSGHPTLVSTGTGSGKTECFLFPAISRALRLRDAKAAPGITTVIVYPMNALADDQMGPPARIAGRLRRHICHLHRRDTVQESRCSRDFDCLLEAAVPITAQNWLGNVTRRARPSRPRVPIRRRRLCRVRNCARRAASRAFCSPT